MATPTVQIDATGGYFAQYGYFSLPAGQIYTLPLQDGVTGESGDGDYTLVFASNELAVYGTGVNGPAYHIVKRGNTNPVGQPFDLRIHKIAQYLVVNGAIVGQRDLRVLGGVDSSNLDPGTLSTSTTNVTTGTAPAVTTLAADTDVAITSPADDQLLMYDAAESKWVNSDLPGEAISVLPVASTVNLSDVVIINQGGVTKIVPISLIVALCTPPTVTTLTAEDGTILTAEDGTTLTTS